MKYIIFTTKHHSGFCMWDTQTTPFNIMNTPYHKDILKEFTDAARVEGLGVGFYYSPEDFCRLHQAGDDLELSVLKAQRIYDDHRWPNPVVIRLDNVMAAFDETVTVHTLDSRIAAGGTFHLPETKVHRDRRYEYRAAVEFRKVEINGEDKVYRPMSPRVN